MNQRAFWTFPERMHLVHTSTLRGVPSMTALTLCRLGSHTRLVLRCEWLTLLPVAGPLPHTAHFLPTITPPISSRRSRFSKTHIIIPSCGVIRNNLGIYPSMISYCESAALMKNPNRFRRTIDEGPSEMSPV